MMLKTIQQLCVICNRLLLIADAELMELKRLGCHPTAIDNFSRELEHIRKMLREMED